MTFFELIRNSLLAESRKLRPPGTLMQTVLRTFRESGADAEAEWPDLPTIIDRTEQES